MTSETLIQIDDMSKVFFTDELETNALTNVHLSVARGEYLSIAGPSGCGKSTLLSILGLLDTPSSGTYRLNGEAIETLEELPDGRGIDALIEIARNQTDRETRKKALEALADSGHPKARELFERILQQPSGK